MLTILCIATYFKGDAFLRECRRAGLHRPAADRPTRSPTPAWPREAIDEIHSSRATPSDRRSAAASTRIARAPSHRSDRRARRLRRRDRRDAARAPAGRPAWGARPPAGFRDKLAMRMRARAIGIPVPGVHRRLQRSRRSNEWAARVPAAVGARSRGRRRRRSASRRSASRDELLARARRAAGDERSDMRARAVRAGRRLSRRLDRLERRGRVRGGVQVRPAADGGRASRAASSSRAACPTIRTKARSLLGAEPPAAGRARRWGAASRTRSSSGAATAQLCVPRDLGARRRRVHRRHHRGGDRHQPVARVGEDRDRRRPRQPAPCAPCSRGDYAGHRAVAGAAGRAGHVGLHATPRSSATIRKHHHAGVIVRVAGSPARRGAARRLTRALLPRLLRDRAAAGAPGRVIKRTLTERLVAAAAQTGATSTSICRRPTAAARSRYPVVYMHDGQNLSDPHTAFAGTWELEATLDRLAAARDRSDRRRRAQRRRRSAGRVQPVSGSRATAAATPMPTSRSSSQSLKRAHRPDVPDPARARRHGDLSDRRWAGSSACTRSFRYPSVFGRAGVMSPSIWFGGGAVPRLHRGGAHAAGAAVSRRRHAGRRSARCATSRRPDGCWSRRASPRDRRARRPRARRRPRPAHHPRGKPRLRYRRARRAGAIRRRTGPTASKGALEFLLH